MTLNVHQSFAGGKCCKVVVCRERGVGLKFMSLRNRTTLMNRGTWGGKNRGLSYAATLRRKEITTLQITALVKRSIISEKRVCWGLGLDASVLLVVTGTNSHNFHVPWIPGWSSRLSSDVFCFAFVSVSVLSPPLPHHWFATYCTHLFLVCLLIAGLRSSQSVVACSVHFRARFFFSVFPAHE